jgi:hypothetical protein
VCVSESRRIWTNKLDARRELNLFEMLLQFNRYILLEQRLKKRRVITLHIKLCVCISVSIYYWIELILCC